LFRKLRPQVVSLTDAFGLSDYCINSPLGCADGDVYRRMFERVQQSTPYQVHPYFERVIKPVLLRENQPVEKIEMAE
jgi:acyl-CoA oxidase